MKSTYAKLINDKGFKAQVKQAVTQALTDYLEQNKNKEPENLYSFVLDNLDDEALSKIHEISGLQATPRLL